MTDLDFEMSGVISRHDLGGRDVRSFHTDLMPGGTRFVEHGSRASAAAHEIADSRGTALARHIDGRLSPGEREVKFSRLMEAYRLLARHGVDVD